MPRLAKGVLKVPGPFMHLKHDEVWLRCPDQLWVYFGSWTFSAPQTLGGLVKVPRSARGVHKVQGPSLHLRVLCKYKEVYLKCGKV